MIIVNLPVQLHTLYKNIVASIPERIVLSGMMNHTNNLTRNYDTHGA